MYRVKNMSQTWLMAAFAVCVVRLALVADGIPVSNDYMQLRTKLIEDERRQRVGGQLVLSSDEQIVNNIFMNEKKKIMDDCRVNRTEYIPSISFYRSKPIIEDSALFKLIRRMPKGAALHLHDTSAVSLNWLVKNATYRENIYMCATKEGFINFNAFKTPPVNPDCMWKLVADERAAAQDVNEFDLHLKGNLSLLVADPLTVYPDNARVWQKFVRYFWQVQNLVYYRPVFRDYFWRMLEECREDNVQYIELRSGLDGVFELDGTVHDAEFALEIYRKTVQEFVQAHPDFGGAKIIMSGLRNAKFDDILSEVKTAVSLSKKYPDFMMGYDMVGNEAFFNPIVFYSEALLYPSRMDPPYKLPYFFHVGETNWQGTVTDDNLVDALLLNSSRIGHGFALTKRPALMQMVKERNIPVEVNPLSNQMLRLVSDLRNHPMTSLIAQGFPIVISSDDFAVWEALPLSYDLYMAFMDLSGRDSDLSLLKQLAINSISYSTMTGNEKDQAMKLWETKWDSFIREIVQASLKGNLTGRLSSHGGLFCAQTKLFGLFIFSVYFLL